MVYDVFDKPGILTNTLIAVSFMFILKCSTCYYVQNRQFKTSHLVYKFAHSQTVRTYYFA